MLFERGRAAAFGAIREGFDAARDAVIQRAASAFNERGESAQWAAQASATVSQYSGVV
jgi:hypothetical protein